MHCGIIGNGKETPKINYYVVNLTNSWSLFGAPTNQNTFDFFSKM